MFIEFDKIHESSRIWIYPSNLKLSSDQQKNIIDILKNHINSWKSHQNQVRASVKIKEDYFVIVAVDETKSKISGCSIDSLQNIVQVIEKENKISLYNRLNVYVNSDNKIKLSNIYDLNKSCSINDYFFDTLLTKKSDLKFFLKPIKNSWCANFF